MGFFVYNLFSEKNRNHRAITEKAKPLIFSFIGLFCKQFIFGKETRNQSAEAKEAMDGEHTLFKSLWK